MWLVKAILIKEQKYFIDAVTFDADDTKLSPLLWQNK
jgi:hypothetical protein